MLPIATCQQPSLYNAGRTKLAGARALGTLILLSQKLMSQEKVCASRTLVHKVWVDFRQIAYCDWLERQTGREEREFIHRGGSLLACARSSDNIDQ
jgi:hypothetical protein